MARDRAAALYINPLMQAAEDLQSRLFNLRDRNGLTTLRNRDPNGSYASETLALIARYLAWQRVTFRHGPYARDRSLIAARAQIAKLLATDRDFGGVGAFCFLRPQQAQLADMALIRAEGPLGPEFEDVALTDLAGKIEQAARNSEALRQSILALKEAESGERISGGARLTAIQRALVAMLNDLETREGFSVRVGPRSQSARGT